LILCFPVSPALITLNLSEVVVVEPRSCKRSVIPVKAKRFDEV